MKHVTFAATMAPHLKGEKRLLPDDVAADLDAKGLLSASEDWPPDPARAPVRAIPKPERQVAARDRRNAR